MTQFNIGSPEWVHFQDWLTNEVGKYQYWTIVAEIDDFSSSGEKPYSELRATLSYLAKSDRETIRKVFESPDWDVQFDLGEVDLQKYDSGILCLENLGDENATIFVTLKSAVGPYQKTWKLWPTFENYFDLRNDKHGNLIDPYTAELVVEIPFPAEKGPVRIRTEYLQDYLAARNMVLVRQHDHRRFWSEPLKEVPEREGDDKIYKQKWGCYVLNTANSPKDPLSRFSRIVAKDIVTPFERAGEVGGKRTKKVSTSELPEFITSMSIDGKVEMQKPNPDDILYSTYFDPRVLKRYYDEPARYSVGFSAPGMGGVSFLDKWSIPIGRNDEGLIIVWLGDLVKQGLPYVEIAHWRAHNVHPRGGMAMDFWNAQMECNPSNIPSLENKLIECRHVVCKEMSLRGKTIYRPYDGPDQYLEKKLRIPLYDDHSEFTDSILVLSKIFIEYLNLSIFKNDLPDALKIDSSGNVLAPIELFSNWLEEEIHISSTTVDLIRKSLHNTQMVRSKTGAAHRFSDSSYQEVIKRLGLSGRITASVLFRSVAEPLASSLESLCRELGVENDLWWIKYADKP